MSAHTVRIPAYIEVESDVFKPVTEVSEAEWNAALRLARDTQSASYVRDLIRARNAIRHNQAADLN